MVTFMIPTSKDERFGRTAPNGLLWHCWPRLVRVCLKLLIENDTDACISSIANTHTSQLLDSADI
jgi:hypothetical protein